MLFGFEEIEGVRSTGIFMVLSRLPLFYLKPQFFFNGLLILAIFEKSLVASESAVGGSYKRFVRARVLFL